MSQDKVSTATSPNPDDTTGVLKDAIGAKEELRKQIAVAIYGGITQAGQQWEKADQIMSLIDKYCETREVEARIDEIELDGAKRSYTAEPGASELRASEFEFFLTPAQSERLTKLRGQLEGHQKGNIENG